MLIRASINGSKESKVVGERIYLQIDMELGGSNHVDSDARGSPKTLDAFRETISFSPKNIVYTNLTWSTIKPFILGSRITI